MADDGDTIIADKRRKETLNQRMIRRAYDAKGRKEFEEAFQYVNAIFFMEPHNGEAQLAAREVGRAFIIARYGPLFYRFWPIPRGPGHYESWFAFMSALRKIRAAEGTEDMEELDAEERAVLSRLAAGIFTCTQLLWTNVTGRWFMRS